MGPSSINTLEVYQSTPKISCPFEGCERIDSNGFRRMSDYTYHIRRVHDPDFQVSYAFP